MTGAISPGPLFAHECSEHLFRARGLGEGASGRAAARRHRDRTETAGPRPVDAAELDALAPAVWPRHAARGPTAALEIAGVDVRDLAETYGTPLFVVDEDDFRSRAHEFAAAFGAVVGALRGQGVPLHGGGPLGGRGGPLAGRLQRR